MSPRESELRSNFRAATKAAEVQLKSKASPAGYLELYELGLITAGEVLNFVWAELAEDPAKRAAVLGELLTHSDESIQSWADRFMKMD